MSKTLITIGIIFIIIGLLYPILQKLGLGNLPGDIYIQKGENKFYFPIVTCIIVSIVFSIILNIFNR